MAAFEAIPTTETGTVPVDIATDAAARRLRTALTIWGAMATKKNDGVLALTLETNAPERKPIAQDLCDALSEQLQLPMISVMTGKEPVAEKVESDPDAS